MRNNVDVTLAQLRQIASTLTCWGERDQFPSVNLGTNASEILIKKLAAVPGAVRSRFPHLRGDEVVAIESVTVTVRDDNDENPVEFRASRTLPMTVVSGDAA